MSTDAVANFFALLLVGGAVGVVALLARRGTREALTESALPLAALVAAGAMGGSLYFSEVADFIPCELCWFQRIAMYPLAVVLTLAAVRRDRAILPYAATLAGAGLLISLYHVQLQAFPDQGSFCELANPCSESWVEALGFMTIPQMAAIAFALVLALTITALLHNREDTNS
jgi:disulfide bond formation protein DsbB